MRILMVHAARDEANEYKVHRLIAEHTSSAFQFQLLCQDSPTSRSDNSSLSRAKVRYADFGRDMNATPKPSPVQRALLMARAWPRATSVALQTARAFAPDVVYVSQQKYDVFLGRLLAGIFRKPLVVHVHYNVGRWLGQSTLRGIRRAARVICVSDFIRAGALQAGLDPDKVVSVINAADLSAFGLPRSRSELLRTFRLPDTARVIIAPGRIDASKGHRALLDAFVKVRAALPDTWVIICGTSTAQDDYGKTIADQAVRLAIADRVIFAGDRSDLPALFAGADVLCLPTENEPCGLVFLEAMAAGLPAVAYRSGGVPEIVDDPSCGFLVEVGDVVGLADRLIRVLSDADLARRLGERGRERARSRFAPSLIAQQWEDALLALGSSSARTS
jgi:glycosyltransferase involved in cell wall biosynthesis